MACKQSLHMNKGEGKASYARNSSYHSAVQKCMEPLVEEAVTDPMKNFTNTSSGMVIADLGCSSGPNAITLASMAVDAIFRHLGLDGQVPPKLCVLLNDLLDNDFNNVANRLVEFQDDAESFDPVFTAIVPGSFYKRLFISSSLHLVLSSMSLHWLLEAPKDLRKNGIPMYDFDESLRKARRPLVLEAYARQFKKDFTLFLNLRAQELVPGGQMVISLTGHCSSDDSTSPSNLLCDGTTFMLKDMASRCVIDKEKLDSFYLPMYGPSEKELREIIQDEGSFMINNILVYDAIDMDKRISITPKMVALAVRAVYEPIIAQHFGSQGQVVEEFETTVESHMSASSLPHGIAPGIVYLCLSLKKKV